VFILLSLLATIILIADRFLKLTAREAGLGERSKSVSLFPSTKDIFGDDTPDFLDKEQVHKLKKGFDIKLKGKAEEKIDELAMSTTYAVRPPDFKGIAPIPKLALAVGDDVLAGDIIFFDKKNPHFKFAAPVSGEIAEIRRGPKRAIEEVVILADKEVKFKTHNVEDWQKMNREELAQFMSDAGLWPILRQRPFDIIPDIATTPENIFVSTFDTAPLAPNLNFVVQGKQSEFAEGVAVLSKLTSGSVHLGLSANGGTPSPVFTDASDSTKHWFKGKHPAGNVGIQIHHVAPVSANRPAWILRPQDVITIGELFLTGKYNTKRLVALTGAALNEPKYVQVYQGAPVADLLKGNLEAENMRVISGDVLSGRQMSSTEHLGFFDDQVSVVLEGNEEELFGWLLPLKARPSMSRTFPNFLNPDKEFDVNTNTHGEQRAFVVSGQYDKVLPMDIHAQQLMKAIMVNDLERMESLGIYELSEEDVALCEFVCTSKQPVQATLRRGLDLMMEQV